MYWQPQQTYYAPPTPVYRPPPPPPQIYRPAPVPTQGIPRLPGVSYNGTITQAPKLSYLPPNKIVAYTQTFNGQRPEPQGFLPFYKVHAVLSAYPLPDVSVQRIMRIAKCIPQVPSGFTLPEFLTAMYLCDEAVRTRAIPVQLPPEIFNEVLIAAGMRSPAPVRPPPPRPAPPAPRPTVQPPRPTISSGDDAPPPYTEFAPGTVTDTPPQPRPAPTPRPASTATTQSTQFGPGYKGPPPTYAVPAAERERHASVFRSFSNNTGFITGSQAKNVFTQFAGVPTSVFADIWDLCNDESHPGKLTEREFVAAMHLITLYTQGYKLNLKQSEPPRELMDSIPEGSAARPQAVRPAPSLPNRPVSRPTSPSVGSGSRPTAPPSPRPPVASPSIPTEDLDEPLTTDQQRERLQDEAQKGQDRMKIFEEQRRKAALAAGLTPPVPSSGSGTTSSKPPSPKPPSPKPPSPSLGPTQAQLQEQERKRKAEEERLKLESQRKQDEEDRIKREKEEREKWEKDEAERKSQTNQSKVDEDLEAEERKKRFEEARKKIQSGGIVGGSIETIPKRVEIPKPSIEPVVVRPVVEDVVKPAVSLTVDTIVSKPFKAHAIFSYDPDATSAPDGLALKEDDEIMIESEDAEWAYGYIVGKEDKKGWMPRAYIEKDEGGVVNVPSPSIVPVTNELASLHVEDAPPVRVVTPTPEATVEVPIERPILYKAKALYDYEASGEGDAALKEGELYPVLEENDDWSLVREVEGKEGWVPKNYLERATTEGDSSGNVAGNVASSTTSNIPIPSSSGPIPTPVPDSGKVYLCKAKILASFTAADDGELTVNEGDVVGVVEKLPDGWWQAERLDGTGKEGLVPESYCEEMIGSNATTGGAPVKPIDPLKAAKIDQLKQQLAKEEHTKQGIEKMLSVPSIPKDQVQIQLKEVDDRIVKIYSELNPLLYS